MDLKCVVLLFIFISTGGLSVENNETACGKRSSSCPFCLESVDCNFFMVTSAGKDIGMCIPKFKFPPFMSGSVKYKIINSFGCIITECGTATPEATLDNSKSMLTITIVAASAIGLCIIMFLIKIGQLIERCTRPRPGGAAPVGWRARFWNG